MDSYAEGDLVWARNDPYPFWPGVIVRDKSGRLVGPDHSSGILCWNVLFLEEMPTYSEVKNTDVVKMDGSSEELLQYVNATPGWVNAVKESRKLWSLTPKERISLLDRRLDEGAKRSRVKQKSSQTAKQEYCYCKVVLRLHGQTSGKSTPMHQCILCFNWFHENCLRLKMKRNIEYCSELGAFLKGRKLRCPGCLGLVPLPEIVKQLGLSSSRSVLSGTERKRSPAKLKEFFANVTTDEEFPAEQSGKKLKLDPDLLSQEQISTEGSRKTGRPNRFKRKNSLNSAHNSSDVLAGESPISHLKSSDLTYEDELRLCNYEIVDDIGFDIPPHLFKNAPCFRDLLVDEQLNRKPARMGFVSPSTVKVSAPVFNSELNIQPTQDTRSFEENNETHFPPSDVSNTWTEEQEDHADLHAPLGSIYSSRRTRFGKKTICNCESTCSRPRKKDYEFRVDN